MKKLVCLAFCLISLSLFSAPCAASALPQSCPPCQSVPSELRQFLTNVGPSDYFSAAFKSSLWSFLLLCPLSLMKRQIDHISPETQKVLMGIAVSSLFFVFFAHYLLAAHEEAKKEKNVLRFDLNECSRY